MNKIELFDVKKPGELESLNLSGNQLTTIENIGYLSNLKELDVSKNKIQSLQFLNSKENLIILKCNYNRLDDWEGVLGVLKGIKELEELELIGNEMTLNKNYKSLVLELENMKVLDGVPVSERQKEQLKVGNLRC